MSTFDQREDSFEKRYVHDEELRFRAEARRNKLLGLWAAEKLGKTGAEAQAYAEALESLAPLLASALTITLVVLIIPIYRFFGEQQLINIYLALIISYLTFTVPVAVPRISAISATDRSSR